MVHVFNRYFIVSRALFWVSQLNGSLVHALEFGAYVNFYQSHQNIGILKKVDTDVRNQRAINPYSEEQFSQRQKKLHAKVVTPFNMHDTLCTRGMSQRNVSAVLIIASLPAIIGFILAVSLELPSTVHLLIAATMLIVFCTANIVISFMIKFVVEEHLTYYTHIMISNTSIALLFLCLTCALITFILTLTHDFFVAEVFISIAEIIMFIRFMFVFFTITTLS